MLLGGNIYAFTMQYLCFYNAIVLALHRKSLDIRYKSLYIKYLALYFQVLFSQAFLASQILLLVASEIYYHLFEDYAWIVRSESESICAVS